MTEPTGTIDLLIEPRWLIPVHPAGLTLEHHAVAVHGGKIRAILPVGDARKRYAPRRTVVLPQHVLIPGLVNLHTHAAMSLLRGIADDLPLMVWLKEHIWPLEARHVSPAFVRDGTLLACAEMLRGGVTCFNDMYFFPRAAAEAALRLGMRAAVGLIVTDFATPYADDAQDYLSKGLALRDDLLGERLLSFCLAPHAPYTVSDSTFERVLTLAEQLELPVHVHVQETAAEVADSLAKHGVRPLERLHRLGLVGPNLIAAHGVHMNEFELDLMAAEGASIAHCPTSNMKLASGIAPIAAALKRGVNVGLGSDGAASNNRLDVMQEMRQAALLAKVATGDAAALDAHQALFMATLAGARALGLETRIGSVEVGKEADLCAVALGGWEIGPCFHPVSHLLYAAGREHVSHVWVGGEPRLEEGKLLHSVNAGLMDIANVWQNRLRLPPD
ncbi:MAG: TRZ/ATZ family hydrolase [Rhodocyclaceae bacterium]|nr:TRZ/ATZ family hydrolase [Rhodocyclaceae bacterium]